ncbi:MAG: hypothetical protein U1A27_09495 [Phycisphaerae bacterium]
MAGTASPSPRGLRLFQLAGALLLLFGVVHTVAVVKALIAGESGDARVDRLAADARALTFAVGPFHSSAWGAIQILNASYAILLLHVGVVNLLVARPAAAAGRLRRLTLVNLLFVAGLLAVASAYQFPPPMLFSALIGLVLAASAWRQRVGLAGAA